MIEGEANGFQLPHFHCSPDFFPRCLSVPQGHQEVTMSGDDLLVLKRPLNAMQLVSYKPLSGFIPNLCSFFLPFGVWKATNLALCCVCQFQKAAGAILVWQGVRGCHKEGEAWNVGWPSGLVCTLCICSSLTLPVFAVFQSQAHWNSVYSVDKWFAVTLVSVCFILRLLLLIREGFKNPSHGYRP